MSDLLRLYLFGTILHGEISWVQQCGVAGRWEDDICHSCMRWKKNHAICKRVYPTKTFFFSSPYVFLRSRAVWYVKLRIPKFSFHNLRGAKCLDWRKIMSVDLTTTFHELSFSFSTCGGGPHLVRLIFVHRKEASIIRKGTSIVQGINHLWRWNSLLASRQMNWHKAEIEAEL